MSIPMTYQEGNSIYWIVIKYFSIFCLFILLIQAGLEALRNALITRNMPERRQGYQRLVTFYMLMMGLPFLVLSIGTLTQGIPSLFYLFLLGEANFFSWAFFGILFLEYVFLLAWVWQFGGAEFLVMHPGLFIFRGFSSTRKAKFKVTAMVFGGLIAMTLFGLISFE